MPGFDVGSFIVNLGTNYLLSRITAQDGPKLGNLTPDGGEYGVGMPRLYGEEVRQTGIFISQADIKEKRHTVKDHSALVGAVTGAVQGFMVGGPVGAVIGGIVGGLFGAATPNQHYYTYSDTFDLLLADRTGQDPIEGIGKIIAAGKVIFNPAETPGVAAYGTDGKLKSITYPGNRYVAGVVLYAGHSEQGLSAVMAAAVGETSAHPFDAHVVIQSLQLAEFGNSVPACDALVHVKTGETLAAIAGDIGARAGIAVTREYSSSALAGSVVRGYSVTGETSCWDALKPLLPVFGCDAGEVGGQIRFNRRVHGLRATIDRDEMGAHAGGDSAPPLFTFRRSNDLNLPKETTLTFIDPARDYQSNSATSTRSEGDAHSNIAVNLALVLTADEGASAAALMHWDAWLGRTGIGFTLTDKWVGIEVGRAYAIPFAGESVPYRLTRRTRGDNGLIEVEGVSDEAVTYSARVSGDSGTLPDEESTLFPETRLIVLDMPILEDAHDDYGFTVVMAGAASYWTRGAVMASSGGVTFANLLDSARSCPAMGDVTGVLAAGPTDGLDDTLDTVSVLTVRMLHDGMTFASATDAELDAWANFLFVGKDGQGEYLQFKTATKIAPKTWELTDLRRGRKGTDWAISGHGADEEFAQLGGDGVFRIVYGDPSAWNDPLYLKGVTLHQDPDDVAATLFVNTGEGKRPYSPIGVEGAWNGSNDVTITWTARSRMNSGALGEDDRDEYEIEITSGSGITRTVSAAEATTFTAADQTGSGITPGDSISGRVRQTSDVNDGRWRTFFLQGPNGPFADDTTITADDTTNTADT